VDAVEAGQPVGPRRQHREGEGGEHLGPAGGVAGLEILHEVARAGHQAGQAGARPGDLLRPQHAARRLDHGPDGQPRRRAV